MSDVNAPAGRRLFLLGLVLAIGGCAGGGMTALPPESGPDAAISARVRAALEASPRVRAQAVTVRTADAVVTLSGFADSQLDADEIERIARRVEGVRSVSANLAIRRGASRL